MRHTGLGSTRFREGCGSSHWCASKQHFKVLSWHLSTGPGIRISVRRARRLARGRLESCCKSSQRKPGHWCHDQFEGARAHAGQNHTGNAAQRWLPH
eukprot:5038652-Amphidinium_carterae.1